MKNNEKFKSLISKEKTTTVSRNKERIKNRARLRESQDIALKALTKLDHLGWSQFLHMTDQCEMCGEVMTKCDFDYCDICPDCLDGE
tara:strand:- start:499 stop:759 length:261 start_codon:yes stop_codon:yes gene_type:complete